MKSVLFITAIFLSSNTMAQPILTAANLNPVLGDVYIQIPCDTTGIAAAVTGPGPGMTWDYSHITPISSSTSTLLGLPDSVSVQVFVNCSSTPDFFSFPNATIAAIRYDSVFSTSGGGSDSLTEYFIADSSQYSFTHDDYYAVAPVATNPESIIGLTYPFSYLSRSVDTSDYYYAPSEETTRTTDTFIADAYGTLKLPSGTYTNALRVHIISFIADTLYFTDTPTLNNSITDSYQWFVPGFHIPIFEINNYPLGVAPGYVYYFTGTYDSSDTGTSTSVHNLVQLLKDVTAYPNPTSDELHIVYTSLISQTVTIHLTDVLGKCINAIDIDHPIIGVNECTISVSNLSSGIYFLQVLSGSNMVNKKINVER